MLAGIELTGSAICVLLSGHANLRLDDDFVSVLGFWAFDDLSRPSLVVFCGFGDDFLGFRALEVSFLPPDLDCEEVTSLLGTEAELSPPCGFALELSLVDGALAEPEVGFCQSAGL